MEKELKENQEITQGELSRRGWKKMGWYANLIAFYKGERTLFFDPESRKIDQIFGGR